MKYEKVPVQIAEEHINQTLCALFLRCSAYHHLVALDLIQKMTPSYNIICCDVLNWRSSNKLLQEALSVINISCSVKIQQNYMWDCKRLWLVWKCPDRIHAMEAGDKYFLILYFSLLGIDSNWSRICNT